MDLPTPLDQQSVDCSIDQATPLTYPTQRTHVIRVDLEVLARRGCMSPRPDHRHRFLQVYVFRSQFAPTKGMSSTLWVPARNFQDPFHSRSGLTALP